MSQASPRVDPYKTELHYPQIKVSWLLDDSKQKSRSLSAIQKSYI